MPRRSPSFRPCWVALWPSPLPPLAPDREAWRKVEAGSVTVVGTASDARLAETAVTLRALVALMPGLVPGAFGAPPPLVAAVVHDAGHLARAGYPPSGSHGRPDRRRGDERRGSARRLPSRRRDRPRAPVAGAAPGVARGGARRVPLDLLGDGGAGDAGAARAGARRPPSRRPPPGRASAPLLRADARRGGCRRSPSSAPRPGPSSTSCCREPRWRRAAPPLRRARSREGREGPTAFRDAFGESERALLERARRHVVESRPLARVVDVPGGAPPVGRLLPLTRTGAAGVLGGVVKGASAAGARGADRDRPRPRRLPPPAPLLSSTLPGATIAVRRDVPAEVDLVNRLIDAGREEEALTRLEALHASLGYDPEMQSALGWDVGELRRLVTHNRLVRRFNARGRAPERGTGRRGARRLSRGGGRDGRPLARRAGAGPRRGDRGGRRSKAAPLRRTCGRAILGVPGLRREVRDGRAGRDDEGRGDGAARPPEARSARRPRAS